MKFDWNNWDIGGKVILVAGCVAVASMFMKWVDVGFVSQTGFSQGTFLFLILWLYPLFMLLNNRSINRPVGVLCSVASVVATIIYIFSKSVTLFGKTIYAAGAGAYVFLFASIALIIGVVKYNLVSINKNVETKITTPEKKEIENNNIKPIISTNIEQPEPSQYNDLEKLADLKNKGIISEDEYNLEKSRILNLDNNKQRVSAETKEQPPTYNSVIKTEKIKEQTPTRNKNWIKLGIISGTAVLMIISIGVLLNVFGLFPLTANTKKDIITVPVQSNGKFGFIDKTGKYIVNPQFETAYKFSEDLAAVRTGNKWGFIDKTGKYIINPQFDEASDFSDGLAPVKLAGKWGFIDKTGKYIVNLQFDGAGTFSEGLAAVETRGKSGFIDRTGRYLINPQFDFAFNFSEGLAAVLTGDKIGFIDKTGRYVISPQFDLAYPFSNGLASVKFGVKWGVIDKSGQYVVNLKFNSMGEFSEGLAAAKLEDKYGYIDKTGNFVINPQFDSAYPFSDGLAEVQIGSKWGFIDKTGKYVVNPQFGQEVTPAPQNDKEKYISTLNTNCKNAYTASVAFTVDNPDSHNISLDQLQQSGYSQTPGVTTTPYNVSGTSGTITCSGPHEWGVSAAVVTIDNKGVMSFTPSMIGGSSAPAPAPASAIEPPPVPAPAPQKVKVIGNSDSKRYHLPGMKYYNSVDARHRVEFDSEEDALRAGYQKAPR